MTDVNLTIPEQLNQLVERGEKDREFRVECCERWRGFRDGEGIADDLANYAEQVFRGGASKAQVGTIRAWPTEPLRLLRSLVIQVLDCPRPDPPEVRLRFEAEVGRVPAIDIHLSGAGQARVRFTAPEVL